MEQAIVFDQPESSKIPLASVLCLLAILPLGLQIKKPDEIPTNEQMMELNRILKEHPAKWMIWEGKPMKESAERLKAIGVDSLVFDPCGNTPDQGDFLSVMRQNVKNLKSAFQ